MTTTEWSIRDAAAFINAEGARIDAECFASDLRRLNTLADYVLAVAKPQHIQDPCGTTIYDQTAASLSPAARRAIFSGWPA